jgi:MFS family permease
VWSSGTFLLLTGCVSDADFFAWGWRVPFVASALLVLVGLYVRLRIVETPAFRRAIENNERVRVPMLSVCTRHSRALVLGIFAATATFVLFYLMTVFALSWGTTALGYSRKQFLLVQMIGVSFFALTIPLSAVLADRHGARSVLGAATLGIIAFGFAFTPLFAAGSMAGVLLFLSLGLALMGLTYGPLGTALADLFPTAVRYTGASLTFNVAGIVGASLAPYAATWLATNYDLAYVGFYLSVAGTLTLIALMLFPARHETT